MAVKLPIRSNSPYTWVQIAKRFYPDEEILLRNKKK